MWKSCIMCCDVFWANKKDVGNRDDIDRLSTGLAEILLVREDESVGLVCPKTQLCDSSLPMFIFMYRVRPKRLTCLLFHYNSFT